jgi:hypothetical protein
MGPFLLLSMAIVSSVLTAQTAKTGVTTAATTVDSYRPRTAILLSAFLGEAGAFPSHQEFLQMTRNGNPNLLTRRHKFIIGLTDRPDGCLK